MAYMNQERKSAMEPAIKAVLKKYGMKGTISVRHHSTLVCTIKSGKLDILQNWFDTATKYSPTDRYGDTIVMPESLDVNHYWIHDQYTGKVKEFLEELKSAMMVGNHDNSDIQTDYFDVGWYINIKVGKWNKPYILE